MFLSNNVAIKSPREKNCNLLRPFYCLVEELAYEVLPNYASEDDKKRAPDMIKKLPNILGSRYSHNDQTFTLFVSMINSTVTISLLGAHMAVL
jgi:hypothetical protein